MLFQISINIAFLQKVGAVQNAMASGDRSVADSYRNLDVVSSDIATSAGGRGRETFQELLARQSRQREIGSGRRRR